MNTISFRSELAVGLGNGIKSYLVVRTPCFHCQGHGFNLWSGKYDSASASKKKKKRESWRWRQCSPWQRYRKSPVRGIVSNFLDTGAGMMLVPLGTGMWYCRTKPEQPVTLQGLVWGLSISPVASLHRDKGVILFNWSVIALQCCVSFCHIMK